ncbi:uncharacterized protein V1516DRAFT_613893, partial [Lipomyces oligophaga]|uniref:uncharacterized protein n=1 Tax=Lipomyces oligophaga TaxID=45792 RepID=UPI0034CF6625
IYPPSPSSSAYTTPQRFSEDEDLIAVRQDELTEPDSDSDRPVTSTQSNSTSQASSTFEGFFNSQSIASRLPTEIVLEIFSFLDGTEDARSVARVCKAWARCSIEQIWYRPNLTQPFSLVKFVKTLTNSNAWANYGVYVRKLNLSAIGDAVSDQLLIGIADSCSYLERLNLAGCRKLTDAGLVALVENNSNLVTLDLTNVELLTDESVLALARCCKNLQVLSLAGCKTITDSSVMELARNCTGLRRLKFLDCDQLTASTIDQIVSSCPQVLELDVQGCQNISQTAIAHAMIKLQCLREYKVGYNLLLTDDAFDEISRPLRTPIQLEALRVLDLSGCQEVTDNAVQRIIECAPKLRNLVLAKCLNISDRSMSYITKLGRSLHYIHLGHCGRITDAGVAELVRHCTRIRYVDFGCCPRLTNSAVRELASLPKLRRIGLVKCENITDTAIHALAQRRNFGLENSLERVHLSYCTGLTLPAIFELLMTCPRLTHLSLTGIQAFLQEDLTQFCRPPPPEFSVGQQAVFCVFSGAGVVRLRNHLAERHALLLSHAQQFAEPGHVH